MAFNTPEFRTDSLPNASSALLDLRPDIRMKLISALSTFLRCQLVKETFGQIIEGRPTKPSHRFMDIACEFDHGVFSDYVAQKALGSYDTMLRDADLKHLEMDTSVACDLEKQMSDTIPSSIFLRAICSLLQTFTYGFLRLFHDIEDFSRARLFCHASFTDPKDPQRQVFCWVQSNIFGGVLCFVGRHTDGLHDIYIRMPTGRAALIYESQADEFASILGNKRKADENTPSLSRFDVTCNPRYLPDNPGAERIYGPLNWIHVQRMQRRMIIAEENEKRERLLQTQTGRRTNKSSKGQDIGD